MHRIYLFLKKVRLVMWMLRHAATKGRPRILIHFGTAPGDDLLCTAVLHELRSRGMHDIWMMSKFPALFEQGGDVDAVVPVDYRYFSFTRRCGGEVKLLKYCDHDAETDQDTRPSQHIIKCLCVDAGITGRIEIRPHLRLRPSEMEAGRGVKNQVAIQTSAASAIFAMRNKEWFPERFQEVVDALKNRFEFVQVGSAGDPLLSGVIDLRGKTTIREAAAILANSVMFIGLVGFLMHLARSVDCRAVIVYGGRELPWQSGYPCNENVSRQPACSPCWRWNKCDYQRQCMDVITAEDVTRAVARLEARLGQPLEVETASI